MLLLRACISWAAIAIGSSELAPVGAIKSQLKAKISDANSLVNLLMALSASV